MTSALRHAFVACVIAWCSACRHEQRAMSAVTPPAPQPVSEPTHRIRTPEAQLHAIAHDIPAFGGFFGDGAGGWIAYVTDTSQADAVRQRLGLLSSQRQAAGLSFATRIDVRPARFTFEQLAAWHELIVDSLFASTPWITAAYVDVPTNRVVVGIARDSARDVDATIALLRKLGVPEDAVRITPIALDREGSGRSSRPSPSVSSPRDS